ncbi:hypothetical protein C2U68_17320 [Methylomonas koyamae]|nr:hypothetical protein C2U68_17320 [Methylomonas koyamae]
MVFRPPTAADVEYLVGHLRQAERNDLQAMAADARQALTQSIKLSPAGFCYAVEYDGELLCICGCGALTLISPVGFPWLVGTPALDRHAVKLTRLSRRGIKTMLERWPTLCNYIDCRNTRTLAWLQRLGFALGEQKEVVPGYPMVKFEMRV